MTLTDKRPTETVTAGTSAGGGLSMSRIVGGGVLVLIGIFWMLERIGAIDMSVTAVLGLGTMVIGISLILLSGERHHGGLMVFGTILALVALATAVAPFEGFQGGVGERLVEVSSVDDIRPDYNVAMGTLTIDLTEIDDLRAATELTASVGMGELVVRVSEGTELRVEASVGAGEVELLGRSTDGLDIDEAYESPGFTGTSQSITLNLQAFAGRVEVTDE